MHSPSRIAVFIIAFAAFPGYAQDSKRKNQSVQNWLVKWTEAAAKSNLPVERQKLLERKLIDGDDDAMLEAILELQRDKAVHFLATLTSFPNDRIRKYSARCLADFPTKEVAEGILNTIPELYEFRIGSWARERARDEVRATFVNALYRITNLVPKAKFPNRELREAAFRKAIDEMDGVNANTSEVTSYREWRDQWRKAAETDHLNDDKRENIAAILSFGDEDLIYRMVETLARNNSPNSLIALLDHPLDLVKGKAAAILSVDFVPNLHADYHTKEFAEKLMTVLRKLKPEASASTEAKTAREKATLAIVESLYKITGTIPKDEHSDPNARDAAFEEAIREMPSAK